MLRLPNRAEPVEIIALPVRSDATARALYLYPPTGRVLDAAPVAERDGPPPIARAARTEIKVSDDGDVAALGRERVAGAEPVRQAVVLGSGIACLLLALAALALMRRTRAGARRSRTVSLPFPRPRRQP